MALLADLKKYINSRKSTYKNSIFNRAASTLFAALGLGISYSDKRLAWRTIKQIQKNPEAVITLPPRQLAALNDGNLKTVITRNKNDLPEWFNLAFTQYRNRVAALEKQKAETKYRWMEYLTIR